MKAALRRLAVALAIVFGAALQLGAMAEVGEGAMLDALQNVAGH